jgi:chorismate dehydratase
MSSITKPRLGKIKYQNVLPVYYALEQGLISHNFQIFSGTPAELNTLMSQGRLEISAASSIEYARNPADYLLLPELAIGSQGPVQSVLLLSKTPVTQLGNKSILLSSQTHTSAALLQMLMQSRYGIKPEYKTGDIWRSLQQQTPPVAFLAIGDEALLLRRHPEYPWRLDLGQAWLEWTGLPFIFGVWVARKSAWAVDPEGLSHGVQLLLASKKWGQAHLGLLASLAAQEHILKEEELQDYFQGLAFDLANRQLQGLKRFYQELYQHGFLQEQPDLEFFPL